MDHPPITQIGEPRRVANDIYSVQCIEWKMKWEIYLHLNSNK